VNFRSLCECSLKTQVLGFHDGGSIFIKGICPDRQGKEVGIMVLQMSHIFKPLVYQKDVGTRYITRDVVPIRIRERDDIFPYHQFLHHMEHCQEKLCEGFVFEEVGILKEPQEEFPFFKEKAAEVRQVYLLNLHPIVVMLQTRLYPHEFFTRPIAGDDKILSRTLEVGVTVREIGQELGAHLTKECAYNHVKLFHTGAFFPHGQQSVDDQRNKEDLNGDKGDILEKIKEGIPGRMKELNLHEIKECG